MSDLDRALALLEQAQTPEDIARATSALNDIERKQTAKQRDAWRHLRTMYGRIR